MGFLKRLTVTGLTAAVAASLVTVSVTPAHADKRCGASGKIAINDGEGGEPTSRAWGHEHLTGDHYIKRTENFAHFKRYHWWADNDSKLLPGRDKPDTSYGSIDCPLNSIP
ncbi:hypothetical protein [Rhizohabitans arisaemae]|uniref:hypothetical protein n=1 Tax=Rhizohabitans arisaemae TaxID=2720610 RepID=UPI0024B04254|nr:hypothetical protein [Rhizohabitans arisaemae]